MIPVSFAVSDPDTGLPNGKGKAVMNDAKAVMNDAAEYLYRRYVKDDATREVALETERVKSDLAQMIYDLRTDAGLTQTALAELIGTKQPAISRLESADYRGHSLSMLTRIATALNKKLTITITSRDGLKRAEAGV